MRRKVSSVDFPTIERLLNITENYQKRGETTEMIHTAQIFTQLTSKEYWRLSRLQGARVSTSGEIRFNNLTEKGIRSIHAYRQRGDSIVFYWCELVLNLNRVTMSGEQTPHPFTVTEENKIKLKEHFGEFIKEVLPRRTDISKWNVKRIDYTFDIKIPNIKEYIALLQRGDKPHGMHIDNSEQHKGEMDKTHYKNGVRYKNKSCTVNIYNKYEERVQIKEYPPPLLEECRNILRVEIQCYRRKVESIMKSLSLAGKRFFNYLVSEERQKKIVGYYLSRICGRSDYYTLDKAFKQVEQSRCTLSAKKQMRQFLTAVNRCKSVWKTRVLYGKETANSILIRLRNLNINPVTIPRRWNKCSLPSLYTHKFLFEQKNGENS